MSSLSVAYGIARFHGMKLQQGALGSRKLPHIQYKLVFLNQFCQSHAWIVSVLVLVSGWLFLIATVWGNSFPFKRHGGVTYLCWDSHQCLKCRTKWQFSLQYYIKEIQVLSITVFAYNTSRSAVVYRDTDCNAAAPGDIGVRSQLSGYPALPESWLAL